MIQTNLSDFTWGGGFYGIPVWGKTMAFVLGDKLGKHHRCHQLWKKLYSYYGLHFTSPANYHMVNTLIVFPLPLFG